MDIYSVTNEKYLLFKVANDDDDAFNQLFHLHHNKIALFIYQLTRSEIITEEIVQDVFMKVWIHRKDLHAVDNFESWIFIIARNHTFNYLKKLARHHSKEAEWREHALYIDKYSTDHIRIDADKYACLDTAIDHLPPQQKKVYLLKRQEGLKNEEVAYRLKISLETVKKHMALALRFIRSYVKERNGLWLFAIIFFE